MRKIKRFFATILSVMMICSVLATSASAASTSDFTWMQATGRYIINLGELKPSSDVNRGEVRMHFVASSPAEGQFDVVLQRQGFLGIWQNVGNKYIGKQCSTSKYDSWYQYEGYVNGQPNFFYWPTTQSGNYRVIIENATNPQVTVITRVDWRVL